MKKSKFQRKIYRLLFRNSSLLSKFGRKFLKKKIALPKNGIAVITIHNVGETYLACAMMDSFRKIHNISGPAIILGTKPYHRQIFEMFRSNLGGYEDLNPYLAECLSDLRDIKEGKIFYGSDRKLWTESFLKPPITHFNLLKICNYISGEVELAAPQISAQAIESAKEKFQQLNLIEGKTILIAPESTSIKALDQAFWQEIADDLIQKGYKIFVNVVNKNNLIKGAERSFLSFSEAIIFADLCKNVIASRSGFCEILSASEANLHLLYQSQREIDIYSLKEIAKRGRIFEYEADSSSREVLVKKILSQF